jgi:hypothetical protein
MRIEHARALALLGMFAALGAMKQSVAVAQENENSPPVVTVNGSMETPRNRYVQLYSRAYDPENDPLTYLWEQVSGPTVTLSNATSSSPSFRATTPGVIELVLRVSDGQLTTEAEVEINVRNVAPVISLPAISPAAPRTNDLLVFNAHVRDDDNDPVETTYEWRRNGAIVPSVTSNSFPIELTTKNDVISVHVTANDGFEQSTVDVSTTILDSPAVLTAVTPPPTSIDYGGTFRFTLSATDPDGDTLAGYEVAYGPAGFDISNRGEVTWTVGGPLFDRVTEFAWGVRAIGDEMSLLAGSVTVNDATRHYPMRRLGTVSPVKYSGIQIADLDADGRKEILIGALEAVYVLSRSGTGYQQSWVYPFDVGTVERAAAKVTAVAAADVEGDTHQEIFFSKGGELVRLNGVERREAARTSLMCHSMKLADLDGNGSIDLACLAADARNASASDRRLVVLDSKTLAPVWSSPSLPLGRTLAVGNVDDDAALEIVASGGYVYDGVTRQNEWIYSPQFGNQVDIGDLDGDGVDEIVGTSYAATSAFSAITQTELWDYPSSTNQGYDTVVVADANGDGRPEAVLGTSNWGNVIGLGYNIATRQPEVLWQIDAQDVGVNSLAVGDVDADGGNEVAWGAGADSSGPDDFVIAGFSPSISVEWTSASKALLDGYFIGGELARLGGGASRLMFAAPRPDSTRSGTRVVALDPENGAIEMSDELGSNWGDARALRVVDYDNDNIDEVSLATAHLYDGYYLAYDFAAAVTEWQSPQSASSVGIALSHVDLNRDGYKDLVAVNSVGYVDVYDMHAQSLLWRSPKLTGSPVTLEVTDLDGDGRQEIVVAMHNRIIAFEENPSRTGYQQRATVMASSATVRDMVVSDLDGDAVPEIYVMTLPYLATLDTFDASLRPVRSVPLGVNAASLFVEDSAFARKNLLITIGHVTIQPELWAIDPKSGMDVWRAPRLNGQVQRDSLRYIDLNEDGTKEIVFATNKGMYRTR